MQSGLRLLLLFRPRERPLYGVAGPPHADETLKRLLDTYLFYSYPNSTFAFQGGEPTLAGPAFFETLVRLQQQHGRNGQSVANAIQTNGILLDGRWCELFKQYNWLVGISIDGPEAMHDPYRFNKQGAGTWRKVMKGVEVLKKHGVEFNVLCVVSQANVEKAAEVYRFFRSAGIEYLQYILLSEFDGLGQPLPFTITPEQSGRFLCETFDLWWPDRRKVRIRYFDNVAEALAARNRARVPCTKPAIVTWWWSSMAISTRAISSSRRIGSWVTLPATRGLRSRRQRRYQFAAKKTIAHPRVQGLRIPGDLPWRLPEASAGPAAQL